VISSGYQALPRAIHLHRGLLNDLDSDSDLSFRHKPPVSPGHAALQFLRCGSLWRARHQHQQVPIRPARQGSPACCHCGSCRLRYQPMPPGSRTRYSEFASQRAAKTARGNASRSDRGRERRHTRSRSSLFARPPHWPALPCVTRWTMSRLARIQADPGSLHASPASVCGKAVKTVAYLLAP
jgi:hypothetical protein